MSIEFIEMSFKNFMSFGNAPETFSLDQGTLTLILGENLDQIGTKNGTGKSSIGHALSWILFGTAIGNKVKKSNLVNKTNKKSMEGVLKFKKNGTNYRIERGRAPEYLRWFVNDTENTDSVSEAQGENSKTQEEINKVIGVSADMFFQTILLTPLTTPFMSMGTGQQRQMIEELLGVTRLSDKASVLKELLRETKQSIDIEMTRIQTIEESNARVVHQFEQQKKSIIQRSEQYQAKREREVIELSDAISALEHMDIDQELRLHEQCAKYELDQTFIRSIKQEQTRFQKDRDRVQKELTQASVRIQELDQDWKKIETKKCPTCGHTVHDESFEKIQEEYSQKIEQYRAKTKELTADSERLDRLLIELDLQLVSVQLADKPESPFYGSIQEAHDHRNTLEQLKSQLQLKIDEVNPFDEQLNDLKDPPVQEIDYETKNDLCTLRDHQDFLLKILTSKDSYVRKRIVEQSLAYLNHRLRHYLEKMNFPYEVSFQSDLEVQIQHLGNDYDFSQLSTGQRGRVSISLTFAFRDVYESINSPVNLLFIDEVLDREGLCSQGVEQCVEILKHMSRDRGKKIFVVSHNTDLQARVSNSIKVLMDGGFSRIEFS